MSASQLPQIAPQSGTSASLKRATHTSGNISLTSNGVWANVDTALDLVLNAVVGDVIEYGISGGLAAVASGSETYFAVVTWVSGAAAHNLLDGDATVRYVPPWLCNALVQSQLGGSIYGAPLVAGDLSAGTVTLRLRYQISSAVTRSLFAGAGDGFTVWAKNLGPIV